jgi:hypothetical protein
MVCYGIEQYGMIWRVMVRYYTIWYVQGIARYDTVCYMAWYGISYGVELWSNLFCICQVLALIAEQDVELKEQQISDIIRVVMMEKQAEEQAS